MGLYHSLRRMVDPMGADRMRREFTMPCSPQEALRAILETPHWKNPKYRTFGDLDVLDAPPLQHEVYLQVVDEHTVDVVAGNRAETYWRYRLSLTGSTETHGTFELVEIGSDKGFWFLEVADLVHALARATGSVGGELTHWP